jgi:hypothetical protein
MEDNNVKAILKGPSWDALHQAVQALLNQLLNNERDVFNISFVVEGYEPYPYVQGLQIENGDFLFEVVGDFWLEPDLTRTQVAQLNALGWTRPSPETPNFTKQISGSHDLMATATYLVTSMRVVFNLRRDVWMLFGDSPLDRLVSNSSGFWHKSDNQNVVCMPDENHSEVAEVSL